MEMRRQRPVVAIQGERGSFSEEATCLLLGGAVEFCWCKHFDEVFKLTAQGKAEHCVIPIENSLAGSIYKNYDLLLRHRIKIVREINLRIKHNLIALKGVRFEEIQTVMSHPLALDQCNQFFDDFHHLVKKSAHDTAGSVKQIVDKGLHTCAAIAGSRAAEAYGGNILMRGIEDNKENFTRFFLLSSCLEIDKRANKTSIVFSFTNMAGALFKSLSVFALRDIDLTKIESRPIRGRPWEYVFYLDFLGNPEGKKIKNALNHLRESVEFLEVLGCYPRDTSHEKKGM